MACRRGAPAAVGSEAGSAAAVARLSLGGAIAVAGLEADSIDTPPLSVSEAGSPAAAACLMPGGAVADVPFSSSHMRPGTPAKRAGLHPEP